MVRGSSDTMGHQGEGGLKLLQDRTFIFRWGLVEKRWGDLFEGMGLINKEKQTKIFNI